MNTRSRATLTAMVATLAVPWLLAGCGTAGGTSPAAGTPPTIPPAAAPAIIFAPEGRLGSVPASLKAAAEVLTVTGRLMSVGSPPGPMLQVFAAGDPPGRPQEARLVLRDPANRLPAATGAGLFVTVRGRFAPAAGLDITVGALAPAASRPRRRARDCRSPARRRGGHPRGARLRRAVPARLRAVQHRLASHPRCFPRRRKPTPRHHARWRTDHSVGWPYPARAPGSAARHSPAVGLHAAARRGTANADRNHYRPGRRIARPPRFGVEAGRQAHPAERARSRRNPASAWGRESGLRSRVGGAAARAGDPA